jgi:hypothetical protein
LAEGFHRAQGLFVLLDLAFGPAGADVPIAGAGDDHLADQEEVVARIAVLPSLRALPLKATTFMEHSSYVAWASRP